MPGPTAPTTRAGITIHERILLYGGADAGKTRALLSIAAWHQKRQSDATFYILNNDFAYEAMLRPGGDFEELENVQIRNVVGMAEYLDEAKTVQKKMRDQDWFTVDLLNGGWEAAQDEYAERVYGEDLADYWLTAKAKPSSGDDYPIGGWEWGPINKRYRTLANNYLMRMPGHVICMSGEGGLKQEAKGSGKGGETAEVKDLFGKIGRKPLGQKDDPHRFHTVLHMGKTRQGWVMTKCKDRERDWGDETTRPVTDFFRDYLVKVGGWKP